MTPDIRSLYKPVQPTVSQASADSVSYTEIMPAETLQPYIYCYWLLQTNQILDAPFVYRVVADGCIDIYFELSNPLDSWVMGFCKKYTEFPLAQSFKYVGVRFLPAMFPQLFGINASELSNKYTALADVLPKVAVFIADRFYGAATINEVKAVFDSYFISILDTSAAPDNRFYDALGLILHHHGMVNVETSLDMGISPRQLRRLFDHYVGTSAKTFSQVVRFQNILQAKPSVQSLRQNKLFFDAGYYDQSHFIKEFKTFYGVTPSHAFGR
jgi:AraC-type DNA-binding domain-containing proteins